MDDKQGSCSPNGTVIEVEETLGTANLQPKSEAAAAGGSTTATGRLPSLLRAKGDTNDTADATATTTAITETTTSSDSHSEPDPADDRHGNAAASKYEANVRLGVAIRRFPKLSAYYIGITLVVVGYGLDLVIVGSITGVESFQRDYGEAWEGKNGGGSGGGKTEKAVIIPALWLALWLASTPAGMIFGSLFGGWFQDVAGRRSSLLAGSLTSAVGVAVIFFSYLPPTVGGMRLMFLVGKLVQGFAIGTLKVTAMTYMSETAPVALRGPAMALFPAGNLLGQLLGSVVVFLVNEMQGRTGYLIAFGTQWVLSVAPFALACVMPESPAYYLAKGRDEDALRAAKGLFAPRADHVEATERMRLNIAEERALSAGASYWTCFQGTNRRRTALVVVANIYPALFGLDLLAKASYFLQTIGMPSSLSLVMIMVGIVAGIVSNLLGIWVISRLGRRSLVLWTLSIAGLLWGSMGVAGCFRPGPGVYYYSTAIMTVITCVCGVGVWPASYAIIGETSSLRLRAKTQALGGVAMQAFGVLMSFVLAYIYNPDAGNLGAKTGFVYLGLCALALALTWFMLPELKGRSLLDIDEMFRLRLPTRQFKAWKREDARSVHEA